MGVAGPVAGYCTAEAYSLIKAKSFSACVRAIDEWCKSDGKPGCDAINNLFVGRYQVLLQEVGENVLIDQNGHTMDDVPVSSAKRDDGIALSDIGEADVLHQSSPWLLRMLFL